MNSGGVHSGMDQWECMNDDVTCGGVQDGGMRCGDKMQIDK